MIVKHLKREFYDTLFGKRLLIIANNDVDSVCTSKILTELFRVDGISFSLLPVDGLAAFQKAFQEYSHTVQVVILVNCGAGIDLLEILNHPKEVVFYVFDSHRPIHVANYYNETNQVRLMTLDEQIDIPAFDDIFRSHMSDDESESEESEGGEGDDLDEELSRKRKRKALSADKRKEHSNWLERRHELLFQYSQFSYFAPPSALTALELSWSMSREDLQFSWWGTVSLTDAYVMARIPRRDYTLKMSQLHSHIARITHSQNAPRDSFKVKFENELCFSLYRHWNLYDSIRMTPSCATALKTWSIKGEAKFHEMLGELGFPMGEVRQKFVSMDLKFRRKVKESFNEQVVKDKYKLDSITIGSFVAEIGFRPKYSAFDSQLACLAHLENPDKTMSTTDKFLIALDCLNKTKFEILDSGFELAKTFVKASYSQIQEFVNMNAVVPRGGFLFAQIPEGAPNGSYFHQASSLILLANFAQQAAVANTKSRRWATLPLVLCAPYSADWWSVVGVRPFNFDLPKNLFGKIFETLAERMPDLVLMDTFDPNIVQVKGTEKDRFIQLLEACML